MIKIRYISLIVLLLSLIGSILFISPVTAADADVRWSAVNIPREGKPGKWTLAAGSDISHLTVAKDGTLYCYATPGSTSYRFYKSTDGGNTWAYVGDITDDIVDIAADPNDANIVYYATKSNVYRSKNAGSTFSKLTAYPGGAGSNNKEITSIAVGSLGGDRTIAVGTRDTDPAQYGGVYTLDESESNTWVNTSIGNYDVYRVTYSPNYAADGQLVAVVTNEDDTIVRTNIGSTGWGAATGDATIAGLTPVSAAVAFPSDYDANASTGQYIQFVAINTGAGDGDIYKILGETAPGGSYAEDLDIGSSYSATNVDVTSLVASGTADTAKLLAGAAASSDVYYSTSGGKNWTKSSKQPTGGSKTYVRLAQDFGISHKAYAATSGTESALSISLDSGKAWNQTGLIDTVIDNIIDIAPSPSYSQDKTLFMLTQDGTAEHSLWRSLDSGASWERVFCSILTDIDSLDLVAVSPKYGTGSQVLYIAGEYDSKASIWKSSDKGQSFSRVSTLYTIDTWTVVNDTTLLLGSFRDTDDKGVVYTTTNSGVSYSSVRILGGVPLYSIAASPDYTKDGTSLVGSTDGKVYWSNDSGSTYAQLGDALPLLVTGATNDVSVAFDPLFGSNDIVYAASYCHAGANHASTIYRADTGNTSNWERIETSTATGKMFSQLKVASSGTLYAANSKTNSGMLRCLDPTYNLGPTFETVTSGLSTDTTLFGLWLSGSRLWSTDNTNISVFTYSDTLTQPVTITSPANNATGIDTRSVDLDWESQAGATRYEWQLDYDTDLSSVPDGFKNDTKATSARMPALQPATKYYWHVRAKEPVLSPWSDKWSFTTSLGFTTPAVIAPELLSPEAGDNDMPPQPVFQWSAISGAEKYELQVATNIAFTSPAISKTGENALPTTAWQSDVTLNHGTTYYWKVRAISANTSSSWSAVGAFTIEPLPQEPAPTPPTPPAPQPPTSTTEQPTTTGTPEWMKWMIPIGIALLLVLAAILVILVLVIVKIFRRRSFTIVEKRDNDIPFI